MAINKIDGVKARLTEKVQRNSKVLVGMLAGLQFAWIVAMNWYQAHLTYCGTHHCVVLWQYFACIVIAMWLMLAGMFTCMYAHERNNWRPVITVQLITLAFVVLIAFSRGDHSEVWMYLP